MISSQLLDDTVPTKTRYSSLMLIRISDRVWSNISFEKLNREAERKQKFNRNGTRLRENEIPKFWNTGFVFSRVSLTSWEEEASLALVCHLLQQLSSFDRSLITHSLPFCWKPLIFTSLNGYIIKST